MDRPAPAHNGGRRPLSRRCLSDGAPTTRTAVLVRPEMRSSDRGTRTSSTNIRSGLCGQLPGLRQRGRRSASRSDVDRGAVESEFLAALASQTEDVDRRIDVAQLPRLHASRPGRLQLRRTMQVLNRAPSGQPRPGWSVECTRPGPHRPHTSRLTGAPAAHPEQAECEVDRLNALRRERHPDDDSARYFAQHTRLERDV